jgi:hypothetical protein
MQGKFAVTGTAPVHFKVLFAALEQHRHEKLWPQQ